MKRLTTNQIRQDYLDYFHEHGHAIVDSGNLVPNNDPTLLLVNAGMVQFKDVFLGVEQRPYKRAVTSQKCMRVSGKHNDLDNVGPSPRHHTFFEMLGNFSFGDYFKEGATRYAYDFMTRVCAIPAEKLWFTVHESDDDAYHIWVDEIGVDPGRVLRMGDKTNFWMMGEVGPCGPTSEIHYDWGPEACDCGEENCSVALDNGCNRWLEVWNLVFMQYDQDEAGNRTPLPRPGVDTGMGLERITSVQQQEPVNYRTDLFAPAMDRIQALLGDSEAERAAHQTAYRVIADHGRAATFLVADGVRPGSEGGEYVLRMIIRRALRFGRKIGFTAPFLAEVADTYIEQMGAHYPELWARRELILRTLTTEEEKFARTLDMAMARLEKVLGDLEARGERSVPGDVVFDLHSTYGLALEITRDVAQEHGFTVDEAGFVAAREAHAAASGTGAFREYETGASVYSRLLAELIVAQKLPEGGVNYDPYRGAKATSEIVALLRDGETVRQVEAGQRVEVVTAMTPFYVEAGGEVSDTGEIVVEATGGRVRVDEMGRPVAGLVVHRGEVVEGTVQVGQEARLQVDDERRQQIRRHHTATHILHRELRRHLGPHVVQAGSLVAPDRLRFDFTHGEAVSPEKLAQIERSVNEAVFANQPVTITFMGQKEAISQGAMALFGEKYGDTVRTIKIGDGDQPYSFELCGGLHVENTGDVGLFRFTREEAVGAGVRRVEAVAGSAAQQYVSERLQVLDRIATRLNSVPEEVESRVEALLAEQRALQKEIERLQRRLARAQFEEMLGRIQQVDGANLLVAQVDVAGVDELREMADWFRDKVSSGVAVFGTIHNDKPMLIATVTEDLIQRGVKAGDLVREAARIVGGGGGGRPNLAQAGGRDPSKLPDALAAVPELVSQALN